MLSHKEKVIKILKLLLVQAEADQIKEIKIEYKDRVGAEVVISEADDD